MQIMFLLLLSLISNRPIWTHTDVALIYEEYNINVMFSKNLPINVDIYINNVPRREFIIDKLPAKVSYKIPGSAINGILKAEISCKNYNGAIFTRILWDQE